MSDPFADLVPAASPSFAGYIPGIPKPKEPKANDPPSGYVWTDSSHTALKPIPNGPADKPAGDPKVQEAERTAAFLATNLTANIGIMNKALKVDPSAAAPTWGQKFAGFFGADVKNSFTPAQRQIVDNSQKLITDAALTLGTGAAYTPVQLEAYQRGFFPQINDDEATIKAKHEALRAALIAARIKAGNQAPQIDEAMKALGMDPTAPLTATPDDALKLSGVLSPKATGLNTPLEASAEAAGVTNLSDDQKRAYEAFLAANPNPSGDQVGTFLTKLTGKTVPNGEEIAKAIKQGRGVSTTVHDTDYQDKLKKRIAFEDKAGLGDNPVTTLAMQGGTLNLSDEAAGVGNALAGVLAAPFTRKLDPIFDYRVGRDEERMRIADARQQLGYGGTAIELVSGAASGNPTSALSALAPKAAAVAAGRGGAVGGALAGYGSGEGAAQSTTGAAVGALAGHVLGRYAPAAVERVLPRRFRAPQGMAPDVADAAKAEGVDLIRPMVDPASRSDYGALESNVYSQPIIRGGEARVRGQIADRVEALGGSGNSLDELSLGQGVQAAARRDHATLKAVRTRLYDRARTFAEADGNPDIMPAKAIAAADAEIAQLGRLPTQNAAEIEFLNGLKSDLSQPGLKLQDIRDIRTGLRSRITDNLLRTKAEARASKILDVARDDIEAAVGEKTATAYRRADTFESQRRAYVRDVIEKFIGTDNRPVEPGKAFQRLKAMASPRGDGKRLAAFYRRLDPDEQADVAASFAQFISSKAPDEPFSTGEFLRQTRGLSPSAMRTIFGPAGEKSIQNLRLLSRKLDDAGKDINRSRSATVLERQGVRMAARNFISSIAGIAGGGALATGHTATGIAGVTVAAGAMGASATRRVLSARAMVNPRVSRWLAESVSASTPAQAKEATRKLGVIIAREPAIAHELRPIYQMLENKLEVPLAASEKRGGGDDDSR